MLSVCHIAVSLRPAGQRERVSGNDALRSLGAKLKHVQQARLVSALICQWRPAYQICCTYIYLSDFGVFFFFLLPSLWTSARDLVVNFPSSISAFSKLLSALEVLGMFIYEFLSLCAAKTRVHANKKGFYGRIRLTLSFSCCVDAGNAIQLLCQ